MLIKISPIYKECEISQAMVIEFVAGKEDYHDYISYEDGLDLVKNDHRFIEKKLD